MVVEPGKIKDSRRAYDSIMKQLLLSTVHTAFVIFMKLVTVPEMCLTGTYVPIGKHLSAAFHV
jgi:hypothetical protein